MININTANLKELQNVKGIGQKTAESIIEYRNNNGEFSYLRDLLEINGIGAKTLESIKPQITAGEGDDIKNTTIEFNPEEYDLDQPEQVHLVGSMNNWDPADKSYPLKKGEGEVWKNTFKLKEGAEYKIMYDSSSWEEDKHVGYYGSNLVVE
ncbi:helix-hairpin-helix domain-containing protein [Halanaerobiaceae bacterium Z-7014]|uniref:Helix-hairpin-helix domain-containing protein n=1 Tax=Halonatronomonas betaini TaxID=2778430 RepID=A0A931AMH1_9FIRM|nr:helix-hairpin-helix domain-containing protein [Halonatronomonas betaini]MBF8435513.1 helix-hairpin-helix domain-containing protein [Halonatronomonas betaini]